MGAGSTDDERELEHPLWTSDHVSLTSVGIDIGSATCQAVFSELQLRRLGRALSSRYVVVSRETRYSSPVHLTPFTERGDIDLTALRALVSASYRAADLAPDDVNTGVVILTGEAADRRNARVVADLLADYGGRFISVAAGHRLEAALAAHGSGAVAMSRAAGSRLLNIDVGGGTTKFSVVDAGEVVATAAMHIGGRLAAFDRAGRIVRLERAGIRCAAACGFDWRLGAVVPPIEVETVGRSMAETILAVLGDAHHRPTIPWLTAPLEPGRVDGVIFSGGVAEYVDDPATEFRGDLGHAIGTSLRATAAALSVAGLSVFPAAARIRATVIGAAEHTVQVSGNTIHVPQQRTLPMRNLRVVRPRIELTPAIEVDVIAEAIVAHLRAAGMLDVEDDLAIAFDWSGAPSFARLTAFTAGIIAALRRSVRSGRAVCLIFDHDVAALIGARMAELLADADQTWPIVAIDGVVLSDLDYIDIGAVMPASGAVPITIKSLVFSL